MKILEQKIGDTPPIPFDAAAGVDVTYCDYPECYRWIATQEDCHATYDIRAELPRCKCFNYGLIGCEQHRRWPKCFKCGTTWENAEKIKKREREENQKQQQEIQRKLARLEQLERIIQESNKMRKFTIIVAETRHHGIGCNNTIPWDIPQDRAYFKKKTLHQTIIMGRRTWESLPIRPLPGRQNIVVTSGTTISGVETAKTLDEALAMAEEERRIFVIGGAVLYNEAIRHASCRTVLVSKVPGDSYQCDTYWDGVPEDLYQCTKIKGMHWKYKARPHPERQYLTIAQRIIFEGCERPDRTGTGTLSLFGERMEFDLSRGAFPLLTTKRVFWKGVVEELLWFLRGCTSAKQLSQKGVTIWDHYGKDDLGPIYGAQWIRQLPQVLEQLKNCPNSRRHVVSAWNVSELDQMTLPPCHMVYQFYVDHEQRLSCQMYQRSADWALGVPFNIASYALLTLMVAQVTGYQPGRLVMVFGDTHLYLNHLEGMQTQLKRAPGPFPVVKLNEKVTNLWNFTAEDIVLEGYKPQNTIKFPFSV